MKKAVSVLLGVLKDKPIVANLLLLVIMMIQYYVAPRSWDLLLGDIDENTLSDLTTIYSTVLSVAAIQSAFAGVVVVFGLSTQPSAFVVLRREAGKALVDNWLSISYSGFLSAGFSFIALLMLHMGVPKLSPWFFEYAVLICVHGIIRLLWLLKKLIQVIAKVDIAEQKRQMSV